VEECKPLIAGIITSVIGLGAGGIMGWELGRGLLSSTSQLNLSRVCHKKTPYTS
jgi:hypothetical protein